MKKNVSLLLIFTLFASLVPFTSFADSDGYFKYVALPGIIEGENYDKGADGCYSIDGVNNGGMYRPLDPIDVMPTNCEYQIVLLDGEWTKYTFNVPVSGAYLIRLDGTGNGAMSIDDVTNYIEFETDGTNKADIVSVWFEAGSHSVKIKARKSLVVNYIQFYVTGKNYKTIEELKNYVKPEYELNDNVYMNIYVSVGGNDNNNGTSEQDAFLTLERAIGEVEKNTSSMTGHIVVNVLPGYYHIDEKLILGVQTGGKNGYNVIFKGTSNSDDTVISGGTQITGWQDTDGDGIWTAPANITDTRTLYINGFPAQRAKSKYLYNILENYSDGINDTTVKYYHGQSDGFKVSSENFFANFSQPSELEAVWPLLWTHQRTPVKNVFQDPTDSGKIVFEMEQPAWNIARTKGMDGTNPMYFDWEGNGVVVDQSKEFYLENAIELLDEPGEFYFDKLNKKIHYYPYAQEDLSQTETYVGTTELMVDIKGNSSADKVQNIVFDNIKFKYGAWNEVTTSGVIGTQTDHLANKIEGDVGSGGISLPAQLTVEFAKNIKILNCEFSSLGSSAIKMENGVSDSLIQGNVIKDVSGTGIMIDSYEHKAILPEGRERCDNINVLNNVINRAATEFRGMTGISMYLPSNTTISHNIIKNVPYSGMSLGWGWGGYDCLSAVNNVISHNYIENVMQNCVDGGHIYTLDTLNNCRISDNYLAKAEDYRGGIYLDSGSEGFIMERNVVENSTQWLFARTGVNLKNNVAKDNYYDSRCGQAIDAQNVQASNNTIVQINSDGSVTWPDAAQSIINNAGTEAQFDSLIEGTELPSWRTNVLDMQPKYKFRSFDKFWIGADEYFYGTKASGNTISLYPYSVVEQKFVPVGNIVYGDTLKFKVNVEKTMKYALQIHIATGGANFKANVYVDSLKLIRDATAGPTSTNWDEYETFDLGNLYLSAGEHTLIFEFLTGASFAKFRLYNKDYYNDTVYDEGNFVSQASLFSDINEHWAENEITLLANEGVINGVSETSFAPEETLTLYQAVWLVSRCIGLDYTDDACWKTIAEKYGLMESTREDETITREEFADIVVKAYKLKKGNDDIAYKLNFADSDLISAEFKDSVGKACALGFVQGDENGCFNPQNSLTRAEGAVIIARLQDVI